MSFFRGKTFVLELGNTVRFKTKQELINYILEQDGKVSFILTGSTDFVLVSSDVDTSKTRRAKQLGIGLLNVEFVEIYRNSNDKENLDVRKFLVTTSEDKENFAKTGSIVVQTGTNSSSTRNKFDPSKFKLWNFDDAQIPLFDESKHVEIGRWAIFKEIDEKFEIYFALELQIVPEEFPDQTSNHFPYRFRYEKKTIKSGIEEKKSIVQFAFSSDIFQLSQLFGYFCSQIETMPRTQRIRQILPDNLGSKLLFKTLFLHQHEAQTIDEDICQLVESLWLESIGDLEKILDVPPSSISLKTIIEAEAFLIDIKTSGETAKASEKNFYKLIRHKNDFVVDLIGNRRNLIEKVDLCQMLRDLATVNELTNWNVRASIEAKYRALKCHIENINKESKQFEQIIEKIRNSTDEKENIVVHKIYSISKQTDTLSYRSTLFNQQELFHGSPYKNVLGILARGLMLPKVVVDEFGINRTDFGCLGAGIYFSDSISTALKYTTTSLTRPDRRLVFLGQVALGNSAKFYSYATKLTAPPDNFYSVHGVKFTMENKSKFVDDEFVVYNLDQQRLTYLIELSWLKNDKIERIRKPLSIIYEKFNQRNEKIPEIPSTFEDELITVAEKDYGLISPSTGKSIPLKSFHVRAQIIDITAQVVLYQIYKNSSSTSIEAKYVFPLEENCSVCGFEAHINNKVIKGVVKEKEQAKKEYRQAIEQGHGAYLMNQEEPDVFSVSVGNLPANCEAMIKITFVVELPIENNEILFRFPSKIAGWRKKEIFDSNEQKIVPSIGVDQENCSAEFSLRASIRMPYEITKLFSPTHRIRRKLTETIGMIEMVDNILIDKDFLLSITVKSVNLPRMLTETFFIEDEHFVDSEASMFIFYPNFEIDSQSKETYEIIFIVDVSNSMDGKHVQQAKQLTHLFLTNIDLKQSNQHFFNIVTFASDNDECFPISTQINKENIDKAKNFVLHSLDHRGNTDLLSVVRRYSLMKPFSRTGRQFVVLSDGHINDLDAILKLFKTRNSMKNDRIFTCAIGETSNKHNLRLLSNCAQAGGISVNFDSNYRSRWKNKVVQLLEQIHQPCLTNIEIDWEGTIDEQQKFNEQAPRIIRSLFSGTRLTVFRFIQNCHKATIKAKINDQQFTTTVFSNKMTESRGRLIHCLAARSIIQDFEDGFFYEDQTQCEIYKKQNQNDLIALSIKYSVVCSLTSFVAIEKRDEKLLESTVRLDEVMNDKDLDILPYIAWDGERSRKDLIIEQLIQGKKSLISASNLSKNYLTNELEQLCQTVSFRFAGQPKLDLIKALIDVHRADQQLDKVRKLILTTTKDLSKEIENAPGEEQAKLDKFLDEIKEQFDQFEFEESTVKSSKMKMEMSQCSSDWEDSEEDLEYGFGDSLVKREWPKTTECFYGDSLESCELVQQRIPFENSQSESNAVLLDDELCSDDEEIADDFFVASNDLNTNSMAWQQRERVSGEFDDDEECLMMNESSIHEKSAMWPEMKHVEIGSLATAHENTEMDYRIDSNAFISELPEMDLQFGAYETKEKKALIPPPAPPMGIEFHSFEPKRLHERKAHFSESMPTRSTIEFHKSYESAQPQAFVNTRAELLNDIRSSFIRENESLTIPNLMLECAQEESWQGMMAPPPPPPPPPPLPSSSPSPHNTSFRRVHFLAENHLHQKSMSRFLPVAATNQNMNLSMVSKTEESGSSKHSDLFTTLSSKLFRRRACISMDRSRPDPPIQSKDFLSEETNYSTSPEYELCSAITNKIEASRVNQDYDDDDLSLAESKIFQKRICKRREKRSETLSDLLLLDVVPLGIGVEDIYGNMCTIIQRNTTIPCRREAKSKFTNGFANQNSARIRIFEGQHKLTFHNLFLDELNLAPLTENFKSKTLEISITFDLDANGILTVQAEEIQSGVKASIVIDNQSNRRLTAESIRSHIDFVSSSESFAAQSIFDRKENEEKIQLPGESENGKKIDFGGSVKSFESIGPIKLGKNRFSSTQIESLGKIQLANGSFTLNEDFARCLMIDVKIFDKIKNDLKEKYFRFEEAKIQEEIHRLIATGLFLLNVIQQLNEENVDLSFVPFDKEKFLLQIENHLSGAILKITSGAISFYKISRELYQNYCEQLDFNYSNWEKFISVELCALPGVYF